jgi:hypothetical protein
MHNSMCYLILYLKFRISLGLERLVNYAGEFRKMNYYLQYLGNKKLRQLSNISGIFYIL